MTEQAPQPAYAAPLFRHCPRCASAQGAHDDNREFVCKTCGFRYFHNVATGVAALVVYNGTVLATRRAHAPAAGTLDLPGGFVDPGESAEAALARELAEELGWATLPVAPRYLCTAPNSYLFAGVRYATCDVFYRIDLQQRLPVGISDEVAGHLWLPLTTLDIAAFGFPSVRCALAHALSGQAELAAAGPVTDTVPARPPST
jgi:NAD+ diphosphatase